MEREMVVARRRGVAWEGRGRVQVVLSQTGFVLVARRRRGVPLLFIAEKMDGPLRMSMAAAQRRWSGNEIKDAKDTSLGFFRPSVGGTLRDQSQTRARSHVI